MPKFTFTGLSITASTTSDLFAAGCDQDTRWLLHVATSGRDGTPKLYLEEEVDGNWSRIVNPETLLDFFPVDDDLIGIKDSYLMGKHLRISIDPADNTTGTITAEIHYKSKI